MHAKDPSASLVQSYVATVGATPSCSCGTAPGPGSGLRVPSTPASGKHTADQVTDLTTKTVARKAATMRDTLLPTVAPTAPSLTWASTGVPVWPMSVGVDAVLGEAYWPDFEIFRSENGTALTTSADKLTGKTTGGSGASARVTS